MMKRARKQPIKNLEDIRINLIFAEKSKAPNRKNASLYGHGANRHKSTTNAKA